MTGIVNRTYQRPSVVQASGLDLDDGILTFRYLAKTERLIEFAPLSADSGSLDHDLGSLNPVSFATLALMQTAITAGELVNGEFAYIPCAADTYHNPEFILARVVQLYPTWRGIIPWSAVGFTPTVLSSSGSGALSADVDGRPVLTVGATDGHVVEALLGVLGGPAKHVRMEAQFQMGSVTNNGAGIASLTIRRQGDSSKYIQVFNQYFSTAWYGGWYHQSSGLFGSDTLDVSAADDAKYAVAKQVAFSMIFGATLAQPTAQYSYLSAGDGSGTPAATNTAAGEGDFIVATQIWETYARLRSTGAAGSLTITGLTYNTRV